LFSCSVAADRTEKSCGETHTYLEFNNTNKSIDLENKTTENLKGQGTPSFPTQKMFS
jgi:hypothetical protein